MSGTGRAFGDLPAEHEMGEGQQRDGARLGIVGTLAGQLAILKVA